MMNQVLIHNSTKAYALYVEAHQKFLAEHLTNLAPLSSKGHIYISHSIPGTPKDPYIYFLTFF